MEAVYIDSEVRIEGNRLRLTSIIRSCENFLYCKGKWAQTLNLMTPGRKNLRK